jgi:hypothetical protein
MGRANDVRRVGKLDIRRTVPETVNAEPGESDEVLFGTNSKDSVSNLFDDDRTPRESRLLRVMSDKLDILRFVFDNVRSYRGMVGHLLDKKVCLTRARVRPFPVKESDEECKPM